MNPLWPGPVELAAGVVRPAGIVDAGLLGERARGAVPRGVADEVGAGGEADDPDSLRVDLEFIRTVTHDPQGALEVLYGVVGGDGLVGRRGAVAEEHGGHADLVQPFADPGAFVDRGEEPVAPAGADDDAGAVGFRGGVDREGRFGDVGLVARVAPLGPDALDRGFGRRHARPEFGGLEELDR